MSKNLKSILDGKPSERGLKVWLQSLGYAQRLLLGQEDPWESGVAKFISFFSQQNNLVKSDVAILDVDSFFSSWTNQNSDLMIAMNVKKRLLYPLSTLLQDEGARYFFSEVVKAAATNLNGSKPLILQLTSPAQWLEYALKLVDRGDDIADIESEDIEDAAMYLADFVRTVGSNHIDGIFLIEKQGNQFASQYTSLLNVAEFYNWAMVGKNIQDDDQSFFDAVIGQSGMIKGLDVTQQFHLNQTIDKLPDDQFYYIELYEDAVPAQVLDQLEQLK